MNLVGKLKEEISKQPFSFAFGLFGFVSLFVNGATLQYLTPQNAEAVFQSDIGVLLKLCLFIIAQGTLCAGCAAATVAATKLGHGFGIILLVLIVVIVTWLLTYNSYWFSTVGVTNKQSAGLLYMFSIMASAAFCLYFLVISFARQIRSSYLDTKMMINSMVPIVFTLYVVFGFGFFMLFAMKIRDIPGLNSVTS